MNRCFFVLQQSAPKASRNGPTCADNVCCGIVGVDAKHVLAAAWRHAANVRFNWTCMLAFIPRLFALDVDLLSVRKCFLMDDNLFRPCLPTTNLETNSALPSTQLSSIESIISHDLMFLHWEYARNKGEKWRPQSGGESFFHWGKIFTPITFSRQGHQTQTQIL